ncbi:MAG TPA: hypothetical protein VJT75_07285, partial [Thermoleophilaceae bacterium]|nr:hypothetical protein [Thermoleophilaceae bacterium]
RRGAAAAAQPRARPRGRLEPPPAAQVAFPPVLPLAFRFFYVIGPIFAAWAVLLTVLGVLRPDFPRRIGGERIVIGVTLLLMLTVILSATIGAEWEHPEQPETGAKAHGERGSATP